MLGNGPLIQTTPARSPICCHLLPARSVPPPDSVRGHCTILGETTSPLASWASQRDETAAPAGSTQREGEGGALCRLGLCSRPLVGAGQATSPKRGHRNTKRKRSAVRTLNPVRSRQATFLYLSKKKKKIISQTFCGG